MNDLTLVYYSACKISDFFANNIRYPLWKYSTRKNVPIVSVTQKPIDFGENICVGDIGISVWNIYYQILLGAKSAKTKFIACCEDDSLYTSNHFSFRPREDEFAYNVHRWNVQSNLYYYRSNRPGMCMCVAPRDLMIQTLEIRLEKYPKELCANTKHIQYFGEPGRYESQLGLPIVKRFHFTTRTPTLTFNHRPSYGGARRLLTTDVLKDELPYWGKSSDLWRRIHG